MVKGYIGRTGPAILCFLVMLMMINTVIITSASITQTGEDLIYLNVLLVIAFLCFWLYGFIRHYKRISPVSRLLKNGSPEGSAYGLLQATIVRDGSVESRLLESTADFLYEDWKKSIEQYQKNSDELNDYITQWVHEIKIPLSVMELLLENDVASNEISRKMKIELERTRFLVNQVLYASRVVHYNSDLRVREFNLEKTVKEAVRRNSTPFIMKNIEVVTRNLDYNLVQDDKWIAYILDQILNNASKYTRENGKVEIWVKEDEKAIRLCIQDNGVGIRDHEIGRVFEKGFTGENGRNVKSTGMGLYYARKIAQRLDIGLEVFSVSGEFTRFELVFGKAVNW